MIKKINKTLMFVTLLSISSAVMSEGSGVIMSPNDINVLPDFSMSSDKVVNFSHQGKSNDNCALNIYEVPVNKEGLYSEYNLLQSLDTVAGCKLSNKRVRVLLNTTKIYIVEDKSEMQDGIHLNLQ